MNRRRILYGLGFAVIFLTSTFVAAALLYMLFALVFSTDTEKRLKRENRMYERCIPILVEKEILLKDAISGLQHKDVDIYDRVFHSVAPNADPMSTLDFLYASDTIPSTKMMSYTRSKADELLTRSSKVDEDFRRIFDALSADAAVIPPMRLPLRQLAPSQVGAATGSRINPFYKTPVSHDGIDLMVPAGSDVLAAADGTVERAENLPKWMGKVVIIRHASGYVTRYAQLGETFVSAGQKVSAGRKIGTVGMSGRSYAPHLHYEVLKDGVAVNPVNHFFASVSPMDYPNMLYISANTEQSMD